MLHVTPKGEERRAWARTAGRRAARELAQERRGLRHGAPEIRRVKEAAGDRLARALEVGEGQLVA